MMRMRQLAKTLLPVLCLTLLSACSSISRLDMVRAKRLPGLQKEFARQNLELGAPVFIRIFKEEGELELWAQTPRNHQYQLFKTYDICTFSGALGPKLYEGDLQAPEGFYVIDSEWMHPESKYHLAMNIGYPNQYDRKHKRTGSFIMIHGDCVSEGCYAMTDRSIEEIYLAIDESQKNGHLQTPVHIFPFRMTFANLIQHRDNEWLPFWTNLKRGYDLFEQTNTPPYVFVNGNAYDFEPFPALL